MRTTTVRSFEDFDRLLERDARARARAVRGGAQRTARKAVKVVKAV